ncbi:mobilisation protein (MobC) [Streptomyces sp. KS_16]|nr:mobilization protein MobC [Streptomyces sp. 2321.6]SDR36288.1 mobilisation protein (MobC) [Streptomyces sp. KS_16]SED16153.1 mobilisation protein (MobC) [Streptomyces sp. 2133.1]SNC70073.1 mobilisation protein (MobC) [Streptomyces sp. 2114.4]
MHDQHHEPLIPQPEMTTAPVSRAASCRVRSPYPASAPEEAKASGAEEAPESAGPGEPTAGGAIEQSSNVPPKPAPRRRLRDKQLREHRISPRYNDDELALVKNAADLSRMNPGGYVAECSLAAARADDPTAAVADYRAMVKALMAANRQLGGIGNNLNQLTWHLNKDGAWPHPDTVQRLLDRVEASIAELDTAVARVTEAR